jgi:hypothetical protein
MLPLSLFGKKSEKTFSRHVRIIGGVVMYMDPVCVSKPIPVTGCGDP